MSGDEANRFNLVLRDFDNGACDVFFRCGAGFQMFFSRARSKDHVAHSRGSILLGDLGLLLRINVLKFQMAAQAGVLSHLIVESRIRGLIKADDGDILLQAAHDLLGLIGKRVQFFGGQIETLMMAKPDEIHDHQDSDYSHTEDRGVGAKLRRTFGEEPKNAAKTDHD